MGGAIGAGHNGEGVKLAVIDTGLEICHPDLAANTAAGGSFNFAHETTPGASSADPFNQSILGDHGTSVSGIAAAVANNGLGGRGVAPEVTLVGFNLGSAVAEDLETALYRSLGASDSDPDSASVDIFNMSFGSELPSENATEDFVRVLGDGHERTSLRPGRAVRQGGGERVRTLQSHASAQQGNRLHFQQRGPGPESALPYRGRRVQCRGCEVVLFERRRQSLGGRPGR